MRQTVEKVVVGVVTGVAVWAITSGRVSTSRVSGLRASVVNGAERLQVPVIGASTCLALVVLGAWAIFGRRFVDAWEDLSLDLRLPQFQIFVAKLLAATLSLSMGTWGLAQGELWALGVVTLGLWMVVRTGLGIGIAGCASSDHEDRRNSRPRTEHAGLRIDCDTTHGRGDPLRCGYGAGLDGSEMAHRLGVHGWGLRPLATRWPLPSAAQ